ncbi:MAG: electron transfer flavoprotein subunit alpha/FixB family protein, partial [Planctomycetota bacterium]
MLVFIEERGGEIRKASLEVLGEARRLADAGGGEVIGMIFGSGLGEAVAGIRRAGAHHLLVADHPTCREATSDALAGEISRIARERQVGALLFASTVLGRELSACVAADLDTCVAADCTEVTPQGAGFRVKRPVYAGKAVLILAIESSPCVLTYRPNYGSPIEEGAGEAEVT